MSDDTKLLYRINVGRRPDGGLRVWSDQIPGLVLSGYNPDTVLADISPALRTLLKKEGAEKKNINRYHDGFTKFNKAKDGKWVLYEDHMSALSAVTCVCGAPLSLGVSEDIGDGG